jgi:hypothetical protein
MANSFYSLEILAGTQGWSAKYDAEKTIPLSDRKL